MKLLWSVVCLGKSYAKKELRRLFERDKAAFESKIAQRHSCRTVTLAKVGKPTISEIIEKIYRKTWSATPISRFIWIWIFLKIDKAQDLD